MFSLLCNHLRAITGSFKLINILLSMPVGTAMVERSFSQMKMIKNRLRNRLSDYSLEQLMRIAIEGPELSEVNFSEILDYKTGALNCRLFNGGYH